MISSSPELTIADGMSRLSWSVTPETSLGVCKIAGGNEWCVSKMVSTDLNARSIDIGTSTARVIAAVSGSITVALNGTTHPLAPGHLLAVAGDQVIDIEASHTATHIEWQMISPPSGLIGARVIRPVPFAAEPAIFRLMHNVTRSLLTQAPEAASHAQTFVYRFLSQVTVSAIADSLQLGSSRHKLFERAQLLIESEYLRSSFNVAELCRTLNTSRSHLYEVFAEFDTTPRREIDRHRIISVLARFDLDHSAPISELVAISGFSSAKQMRNALERSDAPDLAELKRRHLQP